MLGIYLLGNFYVERDGTPIPAADWALRRFKGQGGDVDQVVYSPGGKQILAPNNDKAVRLWPTDYHDAIRALRAELTRDLTPDERSQYGITDQSPTCLSQ